jgi:lipoprotein-anchoring transpeptidase ErfK/SrfK
MKKMVIAVAVGLVVVGGMIAISLFTQEPKETQTPSQPKYKKISYHEDANQAITDGDLLKAQELYRQAMLETEDVNELKDIKKKLEDINMDILFSPRIDECSTVYVVKPNDALSKIARRFDTTVGLLKRSNRLTSDMIKPGQELKVASCTFSVVVDKSQNVLSLIQSGESIKTYVVSTGTDGGTPSGTYKIINKLVDPTWYRTGAVIPPDSPENVLGTRWMGFDLKGYGIHGTTEPEKLGEQVTLGCVRMKNNEVEELYDIIPINTEVTVVE